MKLKYIFIIVKKLFGVRIYYRKVIFKYQIRRMDEFFFFSFFYLEITENGRNLVVIVSDVL